MIHSFFPANFPGFNRRIPAIGSTFQQVVKGMALSLGLFAAPALAQDGLVYDFASTTDCLGALEVGTPVDSCIGQAAHECMEATEGGWSTAGQNACLDAERMDWDRRLNQVYPRLMARLRDEDAAMATETWSPPSQATALRSMQRAWIPWRDTSCAYDASKWTGGTGAGPATLWCLVATTARQTLRLEADMGDDCDHTGCR